MKYVIDRKDRFGGRIKTPAQKTVLFERTDCLVFYISIMQRNYLEHNELLL